MNEQHIFKISNELKLGVAQVLKTAELLKEGATVPFISRYRKEATGSLDEVAITAIRDRLEQLAELDTRRDAIIKSLEERNLLTDDLKKAIATAETLATLEDIYLPYRPKRRTRATIAKEKGLEPLAQFIFENQSADPAAEAKKYLVESEDKDKAVASVEDALAGARDILAEQFSEDAEARAEIRKIFMEEGTLSSKVVDGKETEGAKFKDYFDWKEPLKTAPSHRILAIRRGEEEGFLFYRITLPDDRAEVKLKARFMQGKGAGAEQVALAAEDSFKRLLSPSLEGEARFESKKRADAEAIKVFADNLRELLLASPLGQRWTLAIDPGFRTGCKTVVLDPQGKLLFDTVLYITAGSDMQKTEAETIIRGLIKQFKIQAIAIGNGTASRETETFVRGLKLPADIAVCVVNESGASIYSASEVARKEFPDKDVTVRGAVSIGRRLMDPLAELVKLDPKSIGVGQYQHDVDQRMLKTSLDDTVTSCVNKVGVELNTASAELLSYVSGLTKATAENIVAYRNENGAFAARSDLKKVPRLGPKAFEQCAGFLRIRNGKHPLDGSGVHPESYHIVEQMAKDLNCTIPDLLSNDALRKKIKPESYLTDTVGLPTLQDILQELAKPGRDPRAEFESFSFDAGVHEITDLKEGMKLPGIVTNVTAFGAFVDIGVHQDGLVHVSQLSDSFVTNPADVVKVHQKVMVTVTEVDVARKRIGLSMKTVADKPARSVGDNRGGSMGSPGRGGNMNRPQGGQRPNNPSRGNQNFGNSFGSLFDDAFKKK